MTIMFEEKTISSEVVYKGKVLTVEKDDVVIASGQNSLREVVRHSGGVVIVAQKDKDTVFLVKQFRYPIAKTSLELPAGKLEHGENPDLASKRELQEETGYKASSWKSLGYIYPTPGFCDEKLYLYHATDLTFVGQNLDDGEILTSEEFNINDVFNMIKAGEINDSKTICALTRAFMKGF